MKGHPTRKARAEGRVCSQDGASETDTRTEGRGPPHIATHHASDRNLPRGPSNQCPASSRATWGTLAMHRLWPHRDPLSRVAAGGAWGSDPGRVGPSQTAGAGRTAGKPRAASLTQRPTLDSVCQVGLLGLDPGSARTPLLQLATRQGGQEWLFWGTGRTVGTTGPWQGRGRLSQNKSLS